MIASEVMDFPEPDSPTKPSTSPGAIENERSRTAATRAAGFVVTDALAGPAERRSVLAAGTSPAAESTRPVRDCGNSMVRSRTSSSDRTAPMVSAVRYFFGRDSGGTNPATR